MLRFGGLGSTGLDPGHGPTHCSSSHVEAASHIEESEGLTTRIYNYVLGLWGGGKKKKIGNRCYLRANLPHQKAYLKKKPKKPIGFDPLIYFTTH